MTEATIIYPHQLYKDHPALAPGRPVFIIEEPLLLTEFPTHRQKLLLLRLAMQAYAERLRRAGYRVEILEFNKTITTFSFLQTIKDYGFTTLHIADTTDDWLERRLTAASRELELTLIRYESSLFVLSKSEAIARYEKSRRHMARFYESLRCDKNILMEEDSEPVGGRFSFDADNRQKLPKTHPVPSDPEFYETEDTIAALVWLESLPGEHYGEAAVWLPYTHEAAEAWLEEFLKERLNEFGPYEDALTTRGVRLFHSALSPLMNIGLLSPELIFAKTLAHATRHTTHLPSLEGFIRQILGWREFIRASYECDGRSMRQQNFWQHTRSLPKGFWTGGTGLAPLDHSIKAALKYGYNHHIERLMVLGNYLLLTGTDPDQVYRWFMGMYVDAYDWVMVPNVYGMSQFADGGSFATKPYISGSNYLKKMSDYEKGDWEAVWDALYWNFIAQHKGIFLKNHRLSMMPHLWEKMPDDKKHTHIKRASEHIRQISETRG